MAQKTLTTSYLSKLANANQDSVTQQIDDRLQAFETENTMLILTASPHRQVAPLRPQRHPHTGSEAPSKPSAALLTGQENPATRPASLLKGQEPCAERSADEQTGHYNIKIQKA